MKDLTDKFIEIALSQVGMPTKKYEHPFTNNSPDKGFDCSGFVQWCLLEAGIKVYNVPNSQRQIRHTYEFFDFFGAFIQPQVKEAGDLVFFSEIGLRAFHIAIYLGNNEIVHSNPSNNDKVQIEKLDDYLERLTFIPCKKLKPLYFENPIGYKRPTAIFENRYPLSYDI